MDSLAESDEEMARYIQQLEQARDAIDSLEASADSIAEEFEQYLRRTDDKGGDEPRHPKA